MNCWTCGLQQLGGINALGICKWFDKPKEIPPDIVDKGCKYWRSKIIQEFLEKHNGELI